VIAFDLERFSRQPKDGEKAFRDAINAAAYYSDRLSTRSARGKKLKAMAGEPNGSARPFGFEADLITVREDEAAALRDLTARFLAGESQDALIAELNARGITTSYGKPWTRAGLRQVLTRQRNCGRIVYTDPKSGITSVVGHLPGEPIVSPRRTSTRWSPSTRPVVAAVRTRGIISAPGSLCAALKALDEAAEALAIEVLADPRHPAAIEAVAREVEAKPREWTWPSQRLKALPRPCRPPWAR
jgi:site-specific DNA recombinase